MLTGESQNLSKISCILVKNVLSKIFVLFSLFLVFSCSSISLDENVTENEVGVAPIEDAIIDDRSSTQPSEKNKIIEKTIKPFNKEKKRAIETKLALYESYEPSIYFDYDDFKIKDKYQELIQLAYELMKLNPSYNLFVEGHSDERGTTEYNLALGQKRAEAVLRALELLGVSRTRLDGISFGEEKPIAIGSSPQAWEKNRRADLTIK
ncbi:MAG: hypothetical protein CBD16_02990 [Betaproteobacteria bacterium TMED156]|nr:MAG: hypothetical protein CBD16_02990 [Betaproteobacteria bacterium TMED156]